MAYFHISVICKNDIKLSFKTLKQCCPTHTVGQAVSEVLESAASCFKVLDIKSSDRSSQESTCWVEQSTICSTLQEFGQKFLFVQVEKSESDPDEPPLKKSASAFDVLMSVQRKYDSLPEYSFRNIGLSMQTKKSKYCQRCNV